MITGRYSTVGALAVAFLAGAWAGLAAARQEKPSLMSSAIFQWESVSPTPTKVGAVRRFFRAPTATLDELEFHVTTLDPGQSSHPPHQHPNEELIIVKEGIGRGILERRVGAGLDRIDHLQRFQSAARGAQRGPNRGDLLRHQLELAGHAQGQGDAAVGCYRVVNSSARRMIAVAFVVSPYRARSSGSASVTSSTSEPC